MLTLQSSKSQSVCLLIFKVKYDSLGDNVSKPEEDAYIHTLVGIEKH